MHFHYLCLFERWRENDGDREQVSNQWFIFQILKTAQDWTRLKLAPTPVSLAACSVHIRGKLQREVRSRFELRHFNMGHTCHLKHLLHC